MPDSIIFSRSLNWNKIRSEKVCVFDFFSVLRGFWFVCLLAMPVVCRKSQARD